MIVYKITNDINSKIYIGITVNSLEQRFKQHLRDAKRKKQYPLYEAMNKYGTNNFHIISIDESATTREELRKLEIFYIAYYKSNNSEYGYNQSPGGESNSGEDNPRSKLTDNDIYDIRECYRQHKLLRDVYSNYKNRISYSAFEKIWEGQTWKLIHMDVYTYENKKFHNTLSKSNPGNKNAMSKINTKTLLEARKYFVNHTRYETYLKYGSAYSSQDGFRHALMKGYTEIPIYKKKIKKWILNGKEIDINNYNPVSTISESGE